MKSQGNGEIKSDCCPLQKQVKNKSSKGIDRVIAPNIIYLVQLPQSVMLNKVESKLSRQAVFKILGIRASKGS